jgi:periplasmic protein TonB
VWPELLSGTGVYFPENSCSFERPVTANKSSSAACEGENLMFDQPFVNAHAQTRRPWTLAVSLTLQTGLVGVLVILPMLHPELLKPRALEMPIYLPIRNTPLPAEPLTVHSRTVSGPRPEFTGPPRLTMPTKIPDHASMIADDAPSVPFTGAITGGSYAGIPGLAEGLPPRAEPIPEPKPAPAVKPALPGAPVHVSLGVQAAKLLFGPKPPYPPLAKAARVQGTVKIAAVIALDGSIRNLRLLSGPPLLVKAALDAVQQWRYQPTLLSGNAVEVITEIDVNFTLSQ